MSVQYEDTCIIGCYDRLLMGVIGKTGLSTDKVIIKKPVFFKGKFDFYLIRTKK